MLNKINEKSNVNVFGSVVSTILSFVVLIQAGK